MDWTQWGKGEERAVISRQPDTVLEGLPSYRTYINGSWYNAAGSSLKDGTVISLLPTSPYVFIKMTGWCRYSKCHQFIFMKNVHTQYCTYLQTVLIDFYFFNLYHLCCAITHLTSFVFNLFQYLPYDSIIHIMYYLSTYFSSVTDSGAEKIMMLSYFSFTS